MLLHDELILKIEKLSNLGFGLARHDGQVVFVKNACPQDNVKAKIIKITKNYAVAEIIEIIDPSPHRVTPFCPMQKICGACQLQFIDYNYQLELKKEIVQDSMKSIAGQNFEVKNVIPSPKQKECRRKIQYSIAQPKNSDRLKIGYYKDKSHDVVNIKYCPIQPQLCDDVVNYIRENACKFGITGYNEKIHSGDLRHLVIRSSVTTGKILVVLVINSQKTSSNLLNFAKAIYNNFQNHISGVCVNFNDKKTNLILTKNTKCLCGEDFINEKICDINFQVGPNTFFQVNPESAENIFQFIKKHIKNNFINPVVLDAYAGITAFGFVLSDICKEVVSVEECLESVELARTVQKINNISNIELNHMDAGEFFSKESRKFDLVILDPPRKGCSIESLNYAKKLAKSQIIYISCNPATLARDLKYLVEIGAKVEYIQPFDMFCHTYHIESVAIISV